MTRTSDQRWRSGGGINIDLLEIKYDSTCISLSLLFDMSCDVCRPKMEATIGLTKKSSCKQKQSRHFKSDRWKCHQLWQSKFRDVNQTCAKVQMHVRI